MNLNLSNQPYPFNNYHHLKQYPSKLGSRHHSSHHGSQQASKSPLLNETEHDSSNVPLVRFYRNVSSSSHNLPAITSSSSSSFPSSSSPSPAAVLPAAATVTATTLMPSLFNRSSSGTVNWTLGSLLNASVGTVSFIDSTTPLQPPSTVDVTGHVVLDNSDQELYVGSDSSDPASHVWPTANDIPILIGAAAGGLVLLIILIILLLIWNCCDTNNRCRGGDKSNFNNGSDRSNRSSLSSGSCSSGSGSSKRNSSNLYINNPNSLDAEATGCDSLDATTTSTSAAGHYHYSNYDYGPGPGGGPGHLVIQNVRVLDSGAIPRSVSVPLSRSNSHKTSGSTKQSSSSTSTSSTQQPLPSSYVAANPNFAGGAVVVTASGGEPRSQLSQALHRNIATYYETQRRRNAKSSKNGSNGGGAGSDKSSSIILNDLSLNMDMMDNGGDPFGNVIITNQESTPWVLLGDSNERVPLDVEANRNSSHSTEFYRTRSLPWPQSSRSSGKSTGGISQKSGPAELMYPDSSATIHSGTTTMGRVNFTKKRRNRMRNDSAAAIALNRSGFLTGSLDWDFNDVGRGHAVDGGSSRTGSSKPRPSVSSSSSANVDRAPPPPLPPVDTNSINQPQQRPTASDSPDSPDFPDEAIVVYNERTAL